MRILHLMSVNAQGRQVNDLEWLNATVPEIGALSEMDKLTSLLHSRIASLVRRDLPVYVKISLGREIIPEWEVKVNFNRVWVGGTAWERHEQHLIAKDVVATIMRMTEARRQRGRG